MEKTRQNIVEVLGYIMRALKVREPVLTAKRKPLTQNKIYQSSGSTQYQNNYRPRGF